MVDQGLFIYELSSGPKHNGLEYFWSFCLSSKTSLMRLASPWQGNNLSRVLVLVFPAGEKIELLAVKLLQGLVGLAFQAGSQRHCFGRLELLVSHNVLMFLPARDGNCRFNHSGKTQVGPDDPNCHSLSGELASKDGGLS